jgi:hypothetical protein
MQSIIRISKLLTFLVALYIRYISNFGTPVQLKPKVGRENVSFHHNSRIPLNAREMRRIHTSGLLRLKARLVSVEEVLAGIDLDATVYASMCSSRLMSSL